MAYYDTEENKQTALEAFLDFISRGQYASANVAKRVMQGRPEEIPEAIMRGLAGKEKGSYVDIAKKAGLKGGAAVATGIAGDIFLDPTTYIPIGTVVKPLTKIKPIAKGLQVVHDLPAVQTVGRALSTKFRPAGVDPNDWKLLLGAREMALSIERRGTADALKFSTDLSAQMKDMMKKGVFTQDDLSKIVGNVERGYMKYNLPPEVSPIIDKLADYSANLTRRRGQINKSILRDLSGEEYNHFKRMLKQDELEKFERAENEYSVREFTTKISSDIARKYKKVKSFSNPNNFTVGDITKMKVLPLDLTGISKEHLGELFESTVKDINDLDEIAKMYGFHRQFTPAKLTDTGDLGYWRQTYDATKKKLGRVWKIPTKAHSQPNWLQTAAHELAHVIQGELGGLGAFPRSISGFKVKDFAKVFPQNAWRRYEQKAAKLTGEAREKIWNALGIDRKWLNKNWEYMTRPHEVGARFMELVKQDPKVAEQLSPELYKHVMDLLDDPLLSPRIKDFFMRPMARGEKIAGESVWKNPKTGELFRVGEADLPELEAAGINIFSADIPRTTAIAGKEMAKAEAGTAFFNTVATSGLGSVTPVEGWVKSTAPELKGMWFHPEIAKNIDKTRHAFTSEESTKEFLKVFDKIQNYWKLQTLGIFPAYHFRNIVGNIWNNSLAGISPDSYREATALQARILAKKATKADLDLYEKALQHGVVGTGIMRSEIPSLAAGLEKSKAQRFVEATEKPARWAMEKIGGNLEDNARLAHFMDKLGKGFNPTEAALSVKKYLFDYADLTDFEKNVLRRLMPFYTWTRKNIPLQLEGVINRTGQYVGLEKVRKDLSKEAGSPSMTYMPEYIRKQMPIIWGKGAVKNYFPIERWLPMADLGKIERPQEVIGELLSPIIRTPIELSQNRSWYFKQPIEKYKGETREFLRTDMPVRIAYIAQQIRVINELNNLVGYANKAGADTGLQATLGQRVVRALTGIRAAKYDIERAKKSRIAELNKDMVALKIGAWRASKLGRLPEQKRIESQIESLKYQIEGIK